MVISIGSWRERSPAAWAAVAAASSNAAAVREIDLLKAMACVPPLKASRPIAIKNYSQCDILAAVSAGRGVIRL
jgi:hypothetical protein